MKPKHQGGYSPIHTEFCERTLVTLLRGLGPWKTSIYLIGGLVPRYLFAETAGEGNPAHIGTTDVDIVLNLEVLSDIEAYNRLEENLKRMGFERGRNDEGREQNHRWFRKVENGVTVVIDLLCEGIEGGSLFHFQKRLEGSLRSNYRVFILYLMTIWKFQFGRNFSKKAASLPKRFASPGSHRF